MAEPSGAANAAPIARGAATSLQVPPVVVIYGPSGVGKTTSCIFLDPEALFLAGKGALMPAESLLQIKLKYARDDCNTVMKIREAVVSERKVRRVRTIVIDDWSLAVTNTIVELEQAGKKGWDLWKALNHLVLHPTDGLLGICRTLGIVVVFNCHEKPPKDGDIGGPNLPGQLMEAMPRNTDLVLLMTADPSRTPHGASFRCSIRHYPLWRTKDRNDVCWEATPPNLGEILRAAGYVIERPAGLEWMEGVVEMVAQQVAAAGFVGKTTVPGQAWAWMASQNIPPHLASWVLSDGLDRAEIRMHQQQKHMLRFGIAPPM
jgi:hypothetical protein